MASPAVTATTRAGRRYPALLVGRIIEQAVLGCASLLLAARLGTVAFAPVAALFVVNSAAVALSDYGVGLAVLRCAPGEFVRTRARSWMRAANVVIVVVGLGAGVALGGDEGILLGASALIWWSSAEAFVQKAGAINCGLGERAAIAESVGAALFGVIVVAFASGTGAVAVLGLAFVVKHVAEWAIARHPVRHFAAVGASPDLGALWSTQALGFGVANIDYLVIAATLGASALSVYTIAYRFAVAIPSTIAYVAGRTAVADLSAAEETVARQARYCDYVWRLFTAGAVAACLMAAAASLLPVVLGAQWHDVVPSVVVLALAVPWRMVFGQAGALAISVRRTKYVVRWEAVQLGAFGVAFMAASAFGYGAFLATVALAWIVSVTLFERGAARVAGIAGWTPLRRIAIVGAVLAFAVGVGLSP